MTVSRSALNELTLSGTPLRFTMPNEEMAAELATLLRQWAAFAEKIGLESAVPIDERVGTHHQVVQFLRSIEAVARIPSPGEVVAKCREHMDYFAEKCREHGTSLAGWDEGIAFADAKEDSERVILEVTSETIDHLLNFCHDKLLALQTKDEKEILDEAAVTFIRSENDSRKPRGYFYYGNETAMVETHFDAHLLLDLQDLSLTPTILKTGWWEPWIDILLRSTLKHGMTYVNAGANVGYHTMLGAKLVESYGKVFSFEANPHAYSLLRKSVYFNGFSERTSLFNAGVFDRSGITEFHYVREMLGGGGLYAPIRVDQQAEPKKGAPRRHPLRETFLYKPKDFTIAETPLVTLDEAIGAEVDKIDFLHMDIEGSEGPALLGARKLITRSNNLRMIIEWSYSGIAADYIREKFKEAVSFLIAEQYKIYVIKPPKDNVYTTPPSLEPIKPSSLFELGHCDLFLTRD